MRLELELELGGGGVTTEQAEALAARELAWARDLVADAAQLLGARGHAVAAECCRITADTIGARMAELEARGRNRAP